jgi:solute carrier family 25 citrate transporter 1
MRTLYVAVALAAMLLTCWCLARSVTYRAIGISMVAGALTGFFETMVMYPLEYLKIQQQLADGRMCSLQFIARSTIKARGLCGLYRGVSPVLVGSVPTQALRWAVYNESCSYFGCTSALGVFFAGFLTGVVVAVILGVPVESMKTMMVSTAAHHHSSPVDVYDADDACFAGSAARTSSQLPLLRGWIPTIAKKVCNHAIRYPVHHVALGMLTSVAGTRFHALLSFVAGNIAGMSSVVVTHPVDVVKTRLQGVDGARFDHSAHCAAVMLREEGSAVFWRGFWVRSLRVSLGGGITFALFPVFARGVAAMLQT